MSKTSINSAKNIVNLSQDPHLKAIFGGPPLMPYGLRMNPLTKDVFQFGSTKSNPLISFCADEIKPKISLSDASTFRVKTHPCENTDGRLVLKEKSRRIHKQRMKLFSTSEPLPESKVVSKKKIDAMRDVQYERGEYFNVKRKMRKGLPLSPAERKFYDRIVSHMDTTNEEKTLWRVVTPYEGFEEEIRSGKYEFKGITSTASRYIDFFDTWDGLEYNPGTKKAVEGYIMQIIVPKGKKILECNAFSKGFFGKRHYPRALDEVILPECDAEVLGVNNNLNLIKLRLL